MRVWSPLTAFLIAAAGTAAAQPRPPQPPRPPPPPTLTVSVPSGDLGRVHAVNSPVVVRCGMGNSICSVRLLPRTRVTLTPTAAPGAAFMGWSGDCRGQSTTCQVTVGQPGSTANVTANFARPTFAVRWAGDPTVVRASFAPAGASNVTLGSCRRDQTCETPLTRSGVAGMARDVNVNISQPQPVAASLGSSELDVRQSTLTRGRFKVTAWPNVSGSASVGTLTITMRRITPSLVVTRNPGPACAAVDSREVRLSPGGTLGPTPIFPAYSSGERLLFETTTAGPVTVGVLNRGALTWNCQIDDGFQTVNGRQYRLCRMTASLQGAPPELQACFGP